LSVSVFVLAMDANVDANCGAANVANGKKGVDHWVSKTQANKSKESKKS
jgi:hypothetical protein